MKDFVKIEETEKLKVFNKVFNEYLEFNKVHTDGNFTYVGYRRPGGNWRFSDKYKKICSSKEERLELLSEFKKFVKKFFDKNGLSDDYKTLDFKFFKADDKEVLNWAKTQPTDRYKTA